LIQVHVRKEHIARLHIPQGAVTDTFTSSTDAIEHLRTCELAPDFLITDFSMPQHDGLEVVDIAHARWPKLKCILITGTVHAPETIAEIMQQHSLCAYLSKPCAFDDFIRIIMQHIAL
jgi:DNA-binding NtrC family response regulator